MNMCAWVTSDEISIYQYWWFFNGVFTTRKASSTAGAFMFIHVTPAVFIRPKLPDRFTVH